MPTGSTPFPLGVYLANPDPADPAAQAAFAGDYASFVSAMGAAPQFINSYIGYDTAFADWGTAASWQAWANAATPATRDLTPVIGLPMVSTSSPLTPDQQFQAFAAGAYDADIQAVVNAWAGQGFANLVVRAGMEMNIGSQDYAGDTPQDQADWVGAYQHIYTQLHADAAADGVGMQVVWNPDTTNYSNANAITALYPGDSYVDIVGVDMYGDMWPYQDGYNTGLYHDWRTGREDHSLAQFVADPVNRAHYWAYPAATAGSLDSSGGHATSFDQLLAFAQAHGKPFAVPEAGAGDSDNTYHDVRDDAAFPQWLAQQLAGAQAGGESIAFVTVWDSGGGGNYEFSKAADTKPQEAAAWARYFGDPAKAAAPAAHAPLTLGAGHDLITLQLAAAGAASAPYTISVDGVPIGGTQSEAVPLSTGQSQTVMLRGDWGDGTHRVTLSAPGASGADTLTVLDATDDGVRRAAHALTVPAGGGASLTVGAAAPAPVVLGQGGQIIALQMSEDFYAGNAAFTVAVDGTTLGGTQTVLASHAAGQDETFDLAGTWSAGAHSVAITFLDDAYGGTADLDRNLYLDSAATGAGAVPGASLTFLTDATQSFTVEIGGTAARFDPRDFTVIPGHHL